MSSMMKIIIGIVTIVVAFILFPIIITACDAIGTANTTVLTGVAQFYVVVPTILFVGMLFGGGMLTYLGFRGK